MKPAGIIISLFSLFMLIIPLPAEELSLFEDDFFFEEFFLLDIFGFGEESVPDGEFAAEEDPAPEKHSVIGTTITVDAVITAAGNYASGESSSRHEPLALGVPPAPEESSSSAETADHEESLTPEENSAAPDEDFSSGGEFALEGESAAEEEPALEEDFDEDAFFFEASQLTYEVPVFQTRSFDEIFPGFSHNDKMKAMSAGGLRFSFEKNGSAAIVPAPDSGIDLLKLVTAKNPSHIIEALLIVPYSRRELDMLDIYNALGRIEKIKDQRIVTNNRIVNMFTETTRLDNARSRKPVPDPPPAEYLPFSETMYMRFKDAAFGNLFIRGDVSINRYGITYNMTNFTDVRYLLIRIMKAERYSTIIYLEPVREGILIYSMSGLYLPGFIADRINLTVNINRRMDTLIGWIIEGLRTQDLLDR